MQRTSVDWFLYDDNFSVYRVKILWTCVFWVIAWVIFVARAEFDSLIITLHNKNFVYPITSAFFYVCPNGEPPDNRYFGHSQSNCKFLSGRRISRQITLHKSTKNEVFHLGFLQYMWPNPRETADLVTFTEEIPNGKLHFLCSARRLWWKHEIIKSIWQNDQSNLNN